MTCYILLGLVQIITKKLNRMTENEYIKVKDLGIILSAKNVLRELIPKTSEIVDKKEYQEVMRLISKWERKHLSKIETEG